MANSDEAEQSPWTRPGWVVSAVVVGLIAIMGVIVVVISATGGSDDDPGRAVATSVAPEHDDGADSGEQEDADQPVTDSVCGLEAVDTTGTLPTGPDVDWSPVITTSAPVSDEHGPAVIEPDGFRSCFAKTPEGALIFAATFLALGDEAELAYRAVEELTVPGAGREAAMQQPQGNDDASVRLRIEGFRLLHYDEDSASIDLAVSGGGDLMSFIFDLRWIDGDWRLDLADNGQMRTTPGPIPDLRGYIAWSEG